VADRYIDQWGNPTLVIENDHYQVLLLHGKYSANVGDSVRIGDVVGRESNQGYTVDYQGVPCYNRDCGYHTPKYLRQVPEQCPSLDIISLAG
jgi:hypothetical protein